MSADVVPHRHVYTLTQVAGQNAQEGAKAATQQLSLVKASHILGSSDQVDLVVTGARISPRHAVVDLVDGVPQVGDLGSESGTFVNFIRIAERTPLRRGDLVSLGREALFLVGTARLAEEPADERAVGPPSEAPTVAAAAEVVDGVGEPSIATAASASAADGAGRVRATGELGARKRRRHTTERTPVTEGADSVDEAGLVAISSSPTDEMADLLPEVVLDRLNGLLCRLEPLQDRQALLNAALDELHKHIEAEQLLVALLDDVGADASDEERTHAYGSPYSLTVVARRAAASASTNECLSEALVRRAMSSRAGLTGTEPGARPGVARAYVMAALRGGASPLGVLYADRPASAGDFSLTQARLFSVVGGCVGVRLALLQVSHSLVEWTRAYEQLSHACNVALPNLATQLDGDIGRLELITAQKDTLQLNDMTRLVREECAQMRVGLDTYLRWLRGEAEAISRAPAYGEGLADQGDEERTQTMRLYIDSLVGET